MTKYRIIVVDPPWTFGDSLDNRKVQRGASAHYDTLSLQRLADLWLGPELADRDSLLALWCPAAMLREGLEVIHRWGYVYKQSWVWVKTAKKQTVEPAMARHLHELHGARTTVYPQGITKELGLAFGMGRLARSCKELVLVGTRGQIYKHLAVRNERDVFMAPATKHSSKPEELQDQLDRMFPTGERLELFARRDRPGWTCTGLECPSTLGEDVRVTVERLKAEEVKTKES